MGPSDLTCYRKTVKISANGPGKRLDATSETTCICVLFAA